jgi:hypothetical protein
MLFCIQGNLPGRRDAGQIWGKVYTSFMLSQGFRQSDVDRKVFYIKGKITAGIHVDDCVSSVRDAAAGAAFHEAWCERFGGKTEALAFNPATGEHEGAFLGLRVITGPDQVRIDSPKLLSDLKEKVTLGLAMGADSGRFEGRHVSAASPLAHGGLAALREKPSDAPGGPSFLGEDYQAAARSILGLAGYIVVQYRPDGSLAYSAIAQQISPNFTDEVWRAVLQLGSYLVATKDMALTFRATGLDMAAYADSSALNGEGGHSWGGFGCGQPGSGLTHFRVLCPKQLADSSGGNELITAVLALKDVIAERIGKAELGTLPPRATDLHLDAQVVLDGVAMDRVSRESRYLAAKLSMLREAVANGVIRLVKIATALNPADIFTKPLVGAGLARARGIVLGHGPEEPAVRWINDHRDANSKRRASRRAVKGVSFEEAASAGAAAAGAGAAPLAAGATAGGSAPGVAAAAGAKGGQKTHDRVGGGRKAGRAAKVRAAAGSAAKTGPK